MTYKNPAPDTYEKPIKVSFITSDPDIIYPDESQEVCNFKPFGEPKEITFHVPAQSEVGQIIGLIHVEGDEIPVFGQGDSNVELPNVQESIKFIIDVKGS